MPKAMIVTVGTGKNRQDIASAICKSISQHNPDKIIFVVTELSKKETLPLILSNDRVKGKESVSKIILDENDIEKIQTESNEIIKEIQKDIKLNDITVDYTSGTKAMSAGIILSAIENKIRSISYITGERDKEGRVISGTERIISFEPNKIYANEFFSEAMRSFNSYQYDLSMQLLDEAKNFKINNINSIYLLIFQK